MRKHLLVCVLLQFPILAQEARPDFEVLVLGTIHAPAQFRLRDNSPAHVRAVLELAQPDVVAVESHPEWFAAGRYYDVTYEAQGVAVPWAHGKGLPVYGVDWLPLPDAEARMADFDRNWRERIEQALTAGPRSGLFAYHPLTQEARGHLTDDGSMALRVVNDVDGDDYGRRFLHGEPEDPAFGGRRNRGIVEHTLQAMREHPGKRLVLVIGAGHKAVLDLLFAKHEGVRVLRLGRDVPVPSGEQVAEQWTGRDLVVALGHNLDGERLYFHPELVDLERMANLLEKLRQRGGDERVVRYFEGRLAAARGDHEPALTAFTGLLERADIAAVGRAELYPFPIDHWRMEYDLRQACLLEQALALFALERTAEAEAVLAGLIPTLGEPPDPDLADDAWRARMLAWQFPRALPLRRLEPTAAPTAAGLRDAGFEGGIARSPSEGWHGSGDHLRFDLDSAERREGKVSLCMTVLPEGVGRPCFVHQVVGVPAGSEQRFRLALRGQGVASARVVAYVWDEGNVAREIAAADVRLPEGEWQVAELAITVPKDKQRIGLWVYAQATKPGRLWLDAAELAAAPK